LQWALKVWIGVLYNRLGLILLNGLRLREGWTPTELAEKINVDQANVSKMEHGKRPIGKGIAKKLTAIFHTDYFFVEWCIVQLFVGLYSYLFFPGVSRRIRRLLKITAREAPVSAAIAAHR
jgi:transcriptional regulator with XRE-family HTH domain